MIKDSSIFKLIDTKDSSFGFEEGFKDLKTNYVYLKVRYKDKEVLFSYSKDYQLISQVQLSTGLSSHLQSSEQYSLILALNKEGVALLDTSDGSLSQDQVLFKQILKKSIKSELVLSSIGSQFHFLDQSGCVVTQSLEWVDQSSRVSDRQDSDILQPNTFKKDKACCTLI
jgi:hypothetical protein